ncbi:hypothetical protein AMEX_G24535 [Astyanax mexicanus]|uniref:Uncharacterized protein n=1 Tax=Astyanax mexicanus TaxID=7994 RepID=A0A8T2KUQ8_ASTMX|nr:hypothetical protein AMEX_G24535 [Astyanax mexicanus]
MKAKGGVVGTKLKPHLDKMCQDQSIEMRRDAIIRSLILYLGEKEELFKDCLEDNRSDVTEHLLKILVVHGAEGEDPVDVSILLDGAEILPGCCNTAKACGLLMGLIYALNLAYPLSLRYTFEVFQKLFLELDVSSSVHFSLLTTTLYLPLTNCSLSFHGTSTVQTPRLEFHF